MSTNTLSTAIAEGRVTEAELRAMAQTMDDSDLMEYAREAGPEEAALLASLRGAGAIK